MPLFSYPIPSDWLLPIIEIPLWLASLIFQFFQMIGLVGTSVVLLIVMALFVRNIMGPLRA